MSVLLIRRVTSLEDEPTGHYINYIEYLGGSINNVAITDKRSLAYRYLNNVEIWTKIVLELMEYDQLENEHYFYIPELMEE